LWERPKGKDYLEDQGMNGSMGSKWIFRILFGEVWIGFTWLRIGFVGVLL
jgi:hypothetical protein